MIKTGYSFRGSSWPKLGSLIPSPRRTMAKRRFLYAVLRYKGGRCLSLFSLISTCPGLVDSKCLSGFGPSLDSTKCLSSCSVLPNLRRMYFERKCLGLTPFWLKVIMSLALVHFIENQKRSARLGVILRTPSLTFRVISFRLLHSNSSRACAMGRRQRRDAGVPPLV